MPRHSSLSRRQQYEAWRTLVTQAVKIAWGVDKTACILAVLIILLWVGVIAGLVSNGLFG